MEPVNLVESIPSTNPVLAVIELINQAIENEQNDKVAKYLALLPLGENIAVDKINRLMVDFLNTAYESSNLGAALAITEVWAAANVMEERFSTVAYIFTLDGLSDGFFKFFVQLFPSIKYTDLVAEFVTQDGSPRILRACQRADFAFGQQELGVYDVLMGLINQQKLEEGESNGAVKQFIIEHMKDLKAASAVPEWVKDFRPLSALEKENTPLPFDDQLDKPIVGDITFALPPVSKAVDMLTNGLKLEGLGREKMQEVKAAVQQEYSMATIPEKIDMLKKVFTIKANYDLEADTQLFRVMGPANPLVGTDFTEGNECAKHGGCRMLVCLEFENYDPDVGVINEEGVEGLEWFTGNCDECLNKIAAKHHAVRRPMMQGGWWGCYCSWKCVIENISEPMPLVREMIRKIEKQLKDIGIQDRQYREELLPQLESLATVNEMVETTLKQLSGLSIEIPIVPNF